MKPLTRALLAVPCAAMLPLSGLAAQSLLAMSETDPPSTYTTPDPTSIGARWFAAEKLRADGHLDESLRAFETIADIQQQNGLNAGDTHWQIAEIHFALGSTLKMARSLDAAATEAGKFDDQELQLRALFEAAVAYSASGQQGLANARARAVHSLLDSKDIRPELRKQLKTRLRQSYI